MDTITHHTEAAALGLTMESCLAWSSNGACLYQISLFTIGLLADLATILIAIVLLLISILLATILLTASILAETCRFSALYLVDNGCMLFLLCIGLRLLFATVASLVTVIFERLLGEETVEKWGVWIMRASVVVSAVFAGYSLVTFWLGYELMPVWTVEVVIYPAV